MQPSQRTNFDDYGATSVVNDLTNYGGFGHYRLRTTTGAFPSVVGWTASENHREICTQWTPMVTSSTWIVETSRRNRPRGRPGAH